MPNYWQMTIEVLSLPEWRGGALWWAGASQSDWVGDLFWPDAPNPYGFRKGDTIKVYGFYVGDGTAFHVTERRDKPNEQLTPTPRNH